jgi:poly(hydroxyalkanoate) depolymerase family esterase
MPGLSETLSRLAAARANATQMPIPDSDRLADIASFGSDPGNLRARHYIPAGFKAGAPLVVVLHGCTQNAAGYDHGSGWSALADRHGFALLYPEQRPANNPNRCFNWFAADDITRDQGEALSIRQMIAHMISDYHIDPTRVFVNGLSAGGAMTMVMLATYPELFAGGAVIAGLPYGTATSVGAALQRMRGSGLPDAPALAELVRDAAPTPLRWPRLSVWHGTSDQTVAPDNMEAIIAQWAALQGLSVEAAQHDRVDQQARRRWIGPRGTVQIEAYSIAGLGHGTPIDPVGDGACGTAMPFMLPAEICSTRHIAASWGIADTARAKPAPRRAAPPPPPRATARPAAQGGVAKVISDALRAAGLMR